jgi:hypothetical protein
MPLVDALAWWFQTRRATASAAAAGRTTNSGSSGRGGSEPWRTCSRVCRCVRNTHCAAATTSSGVASMKKSASITVWKTAAAVLRLRSRRPQRDLPT